MGRGETALSKAGVKVRYVIANPSSYVYFSEDRPLTTSEFAHYGGSCAGFNLWKYGVVQAPPYVGQASFAEMEDRYSRRDVIWMYRAKARLRALTALCVARPTSTI